jgi:hypothetical protein
MRLRHDPVLADYRRVHGLLNVARKVRDRISALASRPSAPDNGQANGRSPDQAQAHDPARAQSYAPAHAPGHSSSFGRTAIARSFAWMFSGARLPAPRLLDLMLGGGD